MMAATDEYIKEIDVFFDKCNTLAQKKPLLVIEILHEFWRNLYPSDPYLPFFSDSDGGHIKRIMDLVERLLKIIDAHDNAFIPYPVAYNFEPVPGDSEIESKTAQVYSPLWKNLSIEEITCNTLEIIKERWSLNNIDPSIVKDKDVIDVGCGSGRHSLALSSLGAKSVTAVDYGEIGLEIGRKNALSMKIENINFVQANVLNLPFDSNSFDFVFCNGVLHHTTSIPSGIKELVRVCKPGSNIYLYLYGNGGIFWHSYNKMREIMNSIPIEYAQSALNMIFCPQDRWGFIDGWYVPIAKQSSDIEIRELLNDLSVSNIFKLYTGRKTDLEYYANNTGEEGKIVWGEGELRYLITK